MKKKIKIAAIFYFLLSSLGFINIELGLSVAILVMLCIKNYKFEILVPINRILIVVVNCKESSYL